MKKIPEHDEGEAQEETEGSSNFRNKWIEWIAQDFLLVDDLRISETKPNSEV